MADNIHRFPLDIDGGRPYMKFTIKDDKETKILLPQPPGLTVQDGGVYGSFDLTLVDGTKQVFEQFTGQSFRENITGDDAIATGLLGNETFSGLLGIDTTTVGTTAALTNRVAVNKYQRTTYETQNIRNFSFAFKFAAQSEKESKKIKDIEDAFRKATYPTKVGGIALRYPPPIEIQFMIGSDPNEAMPKIFRTQLTAFNTSFNQSTNAFFKDGAPIEVDMSIELTEDTQLYNNEEGVLTNFRGGV